MVLGKRFRFHSCTGVRCCASLFFLGLAGVGVSGCSSDTTPTGPGGPAGCDVGVPLEHGACVEAGVPAAQCADGFTPDGKQGCEPVLPGADCADGTMPMLGKSECQVVGVPAAQCGDGFVADEHAGCEPILPSADCPDGTMPMLGKSACQAVGVRSAQCAMGFSSDAKGGCEPILPVSDCPPGQMAVPGDTQCHEPQSCGTGSYGDIPVDSSTLYVDASYSGGNSSGTMAAPWTTITDAISHAAAGAVIAVAAGNYPENVTLSKGVRLWGVCASKVTVTGTSATQSTLTVSALPSEQTVEIHGLSVTGPAGGVDVMGASGVTMRGLWVHETGGESVGIHAGYSGSSSSIDVKDTLVESTHVRGIFVEGSTALVERVVVRGTLPQVSDQTRGRGIAVVDSAGARGSLTLRSSLLDQNHDSGLFVGASDAMVEATVIRNTQPTATDLGHGVGVLVTHTDSQRGTLMLTGSLLDANHEFGLYVLGSDATVESTVVRHTQPQASDMGFGRGIDIESDGMLRSTVSVTDTLLDGNRDMALFVAGSDVTVKGSAFRTTQLEASDMTDGYGVFVEEYQGQAASLTMLSSLVDDNVNAGLFVVGAKASLQDCTVRDTQPSPLDMTQGFGIEILDSTEGTRGVLSLTSSLVDRNAMGGVFVVGSDATVEASIVRHTQPQLSDMGFGRGIDIENDMAARSTLTMRGSVVEKNHETGVFVGGSDATIESSIVRETLSKASDMYGGHGIQAQDLGTLRAALSLTSSLVDQNRGAGIFVMSSDATVKSSVIRDTQPQDADQEAGWGIVVINASGPRGTLALSGSLIDENRSSGLVVHGSDATVDTTVIRDTQPRASDMHYGHGVDIEDDDAGVSSSLALTSSLVDHNHEVGVLVTSSDATVTGTVIRHTQAAQNKTAGWGLSVGSVDSRRGTLTLTSSLLDENVETGMFVYGADATVKNTVVRGTQPSALDETFGIGVGVGNSGEQRGKLSLLSSLLDGNHTAGVLAADADTTLRGTIIRATSTQASDDTIGDGLCAILGTVEVTSTVFEGNARASVSNFGSKVSLDEVEALCSPILFDQEIRSTDVLSMPIAPVNGTYSPSRVSCAACEGSTLTCNAVSRHLAPPSPVPPL